MYYKTEQLITFIIITIYLFIYLSGKWKRKVNRALQVPSPPAWAYEALQVPLAHECAQVPEQECDPNNSTD